MEQSNQRDSRNWFPGTEDLKDIEVGLNRTQFASALSAEGILVSFEDWDGLSDGQVLGLVCFFYPTSTPKIKQLWDGNSKKGGNR